MERADATSENATHAYVSSVDMSLAYQQRQMVEPSKNNLSVIRHYFAVHI